jgi:transglutaminase/protease-like cytokinesis protein 3
LEVAKNRQGDCAEFAVLLAAMARAEGIPARVAVGMLYTDRYDDKDHEFVPHAWVIAWVDGRWRSFDPAAARFDSGHIALDTGDGNPWHFFHATDEFGSIKIDSVHTFFEVYEMPTAGSALDGRAGFSGGTK